ncbi:hypothetical protein ACS8FD_05495 [Psychrobacter sp. 1U2]|uniref:hypothetical protein n=1 Tax=Psychrobacter sp. 1U2 TaxID=3453577 RepID=UPI003F445FF2
MSAYNSGLITFSKVLGRLPNIAFNPAKTNDVLWVYLSNDNNLTRVDDKEYQHN